MPVLILLNALGINAMDLKDDEYPEDRKQELIEAAMGMPPFQVYTYSNMTFIFVDNFWIRVPTTEGSSEAVFSRELHEQVSNWYQEYPSGQVKTKARALLTDFNASQGDPGLDALFTRRPSILISNELTSTAGYEEWEITDNAQLIDVVRKVLPDSNKPVLKLTFSAAADLNKFAQGLACEHKQEQLIIIYRENEGSVSDNALLNLIDAVASSKTVKSFELHVQRVSNTLIIPILYAIKKNLHLAEISISGDAIGDSGAWFFANYINSEFGGAREALETREKIVIRLAIPEAVDLKSFDAMLLRPTSTRKKDVLILSVNRHSNKGKSGSSGTKKGAKIIKTTAKLLSMPESEHSPTEQGNADKYAPGNDPSDHFAERIKSPHTTPPSSRNKVKPKSPQQLDMEGLTKHQQDYITVNRAELNFGRDGSYPEIRGDSKRFAHAAVKFGSRILRINCKNGSSIPVLDDFTEAFNQSQEKLYYKEIFYSDFIIDWKKLMAFVQAIKNKVHVEKLIIEAGFLPNITDDDMYRNDQLAAEISEIVKSTSLNKLEFIGQFNYGGWLAFGTAINGGIFSEEKVVKISNKSLGGEPREFIGLCRLRHNKKLTLSCIYQEGPDTMHEYNLVHGVEVKKKKK